MKSVITDAVREFHNLPDEAHVRISTVCALLSVSKPTVWRGVKAGRIPAQRKISPGVSAWRVGDLRAFLRSEKTEG